MSSKPEILTLPDGRAIAYNIYGAQTASADSLPLFYLHGFPSTRLEGAIWHDAALSLGIQLIAPDRPGYGHSSFYNYTILDYANDILNLADHLQIKQFGILGFSGGSPYALACALRFPKERLKKLRIVCGLYPKKLGTEGMLKETRVLLWLSSFNFMTPVIKFVMDQAAGKVARDEEHPEAFEKMHESQMAGRPEQDRRCMEDESFKRKFIESGRESFRQGSQAFAYECHLLSVDWGFELEEVDFDGIVIWHGEADVNVPITMARKGHELIRGSTLKEVPNEAHVSLGVNHARSILAM